MNNHNLKEKTLDPNYEYSLPDIAEKLYMSVNTASSLEKKAIINFKIELLARGYTIKDLLA
jgi:hypothetical protein